MTFRCYTCRKVINYIMYPCKCDKLFCDAHRLWFMHKCTFDWKLSHQNDIRKSFVSRKSYYSPPHNEGAAA